ncbi:hypothetical protein [Hymenobacter sp. PAMC 26628]|uniref:hypothetical protein n=1 Tax=Hymenobacter sp. PAMC 26628 TaxID=1484118 RepID=UPI00077011ED|nr:hypothetical protein [Hymenobacter sp. PAMC 26628]AMJ65109.1 hypothetical protein AXW84_06480 [Hymenobacter sp. PAMC 26628]
MSNSPAAPVPHLSAADLRRALDELDAKIHTLRQRAYATAAGSPATYQAHADALEAKRARLATQLTEHASAGAAEPGAWASIWRGIEALREDLRNIL